MIADPGLSAAHACFDRAISRVDALPLDTNPFCRLNLAGAWTDPAHLPLTVSPVLASNSARQALARLIEFEAHPLPSTG